MTNRPTRHRLAWLSAPLLCGVALGLAACGTASRPYTASVVPIFIPIDRSGHALPPGSADACSPDRWGSDQRGPDDATRLTRAQKEALFRRFAAERGGAPAIIPLPPDEAPAQPIACRVAGT